MALICDTCGQPIKNYSDGLIECKRRIKDGTDIGIHLVHRKSESPMMPAGCCYVLNTMEYDMPYDQLDDIMSCSKKDRVELLDAYVTDGYAPKQDVERIKKLLGI